MGCLSIQTVYIWLLSYKNGSLGPKHECFVCYVCLFFQFKHKVAVCHPGTFAVCSVQCVCGGDCSDLSALNLVCFANISYGVAVSRYAINISLSQAVLKLVKRSAGKSAPEQWLLRVKRANEANVLAILHQVFTFALMKNTHIIIIIIIENIQVLWL